MARSGDTTTESASEAVADVYDALAPIYDAMGGARPFAMLVAERVEELIATRRSRLRDRGETPAPASVSAVETALLSDAVSFLDLGCGTGTLLLALRALHPGWRLCGVDVSPGMLAVAGRKPGHESVLWVRARLPAALPFTERFDLVGAFYDTLNHLPDHDALAATFRTVASVLRPGGLFVFDLNNAFGFETWWQYRVELDLEGRHLETELDYDARARTARAAIGLESGGRERQFVLRERCFSEPEVEGALRAAGLVPELTAPWCPVNPHSPSKTWFVAVNRR
ncbi:MAG TPA: class I SAM-dependent methyltransferase [Polyangia bacterium]|nr:class I SAM-dependent methyltransferase [Polyangia bacterium]